MNFQISTQWLGLLPFAEGLKIQERVAQDVGESRRVQILGCEHPAVISMGRRARLKDDLLISENEIHGLGIALYWVDRGGQATIHSPGQLVIYPVLDLREWGLGARQYIKALVATTRELLMGYGIESHEIEGQPGIFVEGKKIASIGVRICHGVTQQGLALNVANDLDHFRWIRPCGQSVGVMTRLIDHGVRSDLVEILGTWTELFGSRLSLTPSLGHGLNERSSAPGALVGI